MAFMTKQQLVSSTAFEGSFQYTTPGDPTSDLIYVVPNDKQGSVTVKAQLRSTEGTELTKSDGSTIAAVTDTINVS